MKDNSSVLLQLKTIYSLVTSSQLKQKLFRLPSAQAKKFVKLLMSILKRQVSSSSVFVSFFTVMKHNFSVNFKCNFNLHFLLWTKEFFFLSGFSFTDTDNLQDSRGREGTIFYSTLPLPSHKVPILTLLSTLVNICQIPHVIFEATSQFFFKFCITVQCLER